MTESNTVTAPEQAEHIPLTPGAMLRDARERSGQTLAAVGEALHLTVHYIKALENDDYSKLPGLIFVKGYIRSYGHYLKMDVDALISSYDSHLGTLNHGEERQNNYTYERRQHSRRRSDQSYGWALVAGFIVIVALGAGWWFVGRQPANESGATRSSTSTPAAATNNSASAVMRQNITSPQATRPASTASTISTPVAANAGDTATASTLLQNAQSTAAAAITAPATASGNFSDTTDAASIAAQELPTADVTSAATAIAPTGEVIQSTVDSAVLQTTVVDGGVTVIPAADGSRQVSMFGVGSDELQFHFAGDSWVEIDDGSNVRLYSDMLNSGDTLTIQGTAPFQVLLGNARNVEVNFNDSAIDIAASIREDNTARLQLDNPNNQAPVAGTGVAQ